MMLDSAEPAIDPRLPGAAEVSDKSGLSVHEPTYDGVWVSLQPVQREHGPFLYRLAIDPKVGYRWRLRGVVPSYANFEGLLWQGIVAQFVIVRRRTQEPIGHVLAYNANVTARHVSAGVATVPGTHGRGLGMEGTILFLKVLFDTYNLRKVFFELPEYNLQQFAGARRKYLTFEGTLSDHDYFGGRYWDTYYFSIDRETVDRLPILSWRRRADQ